MLYPEALQTKLLDGDEKIRATTCRLYLQLDYETALHHVSKSQLESLADRGADRKVCLIITCNY
jgi:sister chromatid cohesion protein PDS5